MTTLSFHRRDQRCSTHGSVLIVAVAALALMMILLVALLQGASHETRGAESEATLAREKMLADTATALVIGQLQQATTQTGQAWISQPGLLRTYDMTGSRKPTASYKLYSAAQMTDTSGTLDFLATDSPVDWNSEVNKPFYTDLNAPVEMPGILSSPIYPILDAGAVGSIKGVGSDRESSVEMPVTWIYQLQDGSLGPAINATKENPIVARIAYWTDDETCKINVNTAGCGSGWNTPHANSADDVTWRKNQAAAGEFSSYPGHPATTSLALAFSGLSPEQLLSLSPRYAWGGSQMVTQPTSPGQALAMKTDRLYATLDELCFGAAFSLPREANPVTPAQIETARFVLTATSRAPETTMLGEPRVAIWPVYDSQDATHTTAADRAIASAATVGARNYYFQRHDPFDATDDFNDASRPTATASNVALFSELVKRGDEVLPGIGGSFTQKYPGAKWTQLVLEMTDFIHALNAVDPTPAPFVPFTGGDASGLGHGFVVPQTIEYAGPDGKTTLRGLGRCSTFSGFTLVFYVCGFAFNHDPNKDEKPKDYINYDETPDDAAGTSWQTLFAPTSSKNRWKEVTHEMVRAFVVPTTYKPGCGFPEVSEACDLQITGLDQMGGTIGSGTGGPFTSGFLGSPLKAIAPTRAWGGNEGPIAWRAAGDELASSGTKAYPFAGTKAFLVPLSPTPVADATTGTVAWPTSMPTVEFTKPTSLTATIRDKNGQPLQTFALKLPAFAFSAPTILGEADHRDDPIHSVSSWTENPSCAVKPSWYMSLSHRLLATQGNRPLMIQAGDVSRSIEPSTDLRVIAGLTSLSEAFFQPHVGFSPPTTPLTVPTPNLQGGSHAHNLRFADGTSACFAPGRLNNNAPLNASTYKSTDLENSAYALNRLVPTASYPSDSSSLLTVTDWSDGKTQVPYLVFSNASCSVPTGTSSVTMASPGSSSPLLGDWDTGPGLAPDGALTNLPDAGTAMAGETAYGSLTSGQPGAATQRTPNALIPSPVIFGSLPAGIDPIHPEQSQPWRTLLFCPYPAANTSPTPYSVHPGAASPPDYLILDNFWMPVVEPYPISGVMVTAGKVNLNDQIAPFTWLHRSTALRALLNDLRIPAISAISASKYKTAGATLGSIWKGVNADATIAQIENRFAGGKTDAYLSESEICAVPLVPANQGSTDVTSTQAALSSFWNGNSSSGRLTGDNLRELPYAQLEGRLTTRSNSYTVHVRVQVLQKLTRDPKQNTWNEGTDRILGDWRGSYEIERYLDPKAVAPVAGQPLGPYKFRIVSSQRFAP